MRVSFRHGIVRHQTPNFINIGSTHVDLLASPSTPFLATIANSSKNILLTETSNVINAWTISPSVDQWLYIDINTTTGVRTFGVTVVEPIVSTTAPSNPVNDLHWFDKTNYRMKVWNGSKWVNKIRICILLLANGSTPTSLSDNLSTFIGTQISDNTVANTGAIIYDQNNLPLRDGNNEVVITVDTLHAPSFPESPIVLDYDQLTGVALSSIPNHSFVKFSDYGTIVAATSISLSNGDVIGIIEPDVTAGSSVTVITKGVVRYDNWDWSALAVNAPLYINDSGVLRTTPLFSGQLPVARVVDVDAIIVGAAQAAPIQLSGDVIAQGNTLNGATATLVNVVTAGTATKVTYDNKGRITNGTTLSAGDIPNLDWTKITTSVPTTWQGYGITNIPPYAISFDKIGAPSASELIGLHVVTESVTLPINLTGSRGWAKTVATAQTNFDLQYNGSSIGTVRFALGSNTPTFIVGTAVNMAPGGRLELHAPNSPDATLDTLTVSIIATR